VQYDRLKFLFPNLRDQRTPDPPMAAAFRPDQCPFLHTNVILFSKTLRGDATVVRRALPGLDDEDDDDDDDESIGYVRPLLQAR